MTDANPKTVVLLGATGFLGLAIAGRLAADGQADVHGFSSTTSLWKTISASCSAMVRLALLEGLK